MIKRQFSKTFMLLFISFMLLSINVLSAQSLKINPKTSTMTIYGTTNVHNFTIKVGQINGELAISSKKVQSLSVEIPVRGLKSNESLMNTKTYEAFNEPKNPKISFQLTDAESLQVAGDEVNVTVNGNLTMAGVTKKISFKTTGKNLKPGVYDFKGSIALKMSDFKMKPPTAMLGMMKVGDAITLKYDIYLEGAAIN
ncbi:MAG: YceI family protein [Paludibacter sp.]|nr:YceI family protein [Paludibacter sp.]